MDYSSPREQLTGKLLDARTDLRHGFGDYVQVGNQVNDNTMEERTRGAIALMPVGNLEGGWHYLLLRTWKTIKRNRADLLPMPDVVIGYINDKATEERNMRPRVQNDNMRIGLWRGDRVVDVQDDVDDEDIDDLQAVEEVFDAEIFVPQEAAAEVNIEVDEEADEIEVDVEAREERNAVDEEEVNDGAGGAVNAEDAELAI